MFFEIAIFVVFAIIPTFSTNGTVFLNSTTGVKIQNISENVPYNVSKDGKTYFFKYNTNNNQFRIYNRVSVNPLVVQNGTEVVLTKRKTSKMANRTNMNVS